MAISALHSMTNHHHGPSLFEAAANVLQVWRSRREQRRELARMSERDLHDAGISWSDALYEADKPFWRA